MPQHPDTHVYRTYDKVLEGTRNEAASGGNRGWWPDRVDLGQLRSRRTVDAGYADRFRSLDLDELARDIDEVLTTSQDWWPADFGHYGPLVLRMAWHAAGTYRVGDGRGGASAGMLSFAPVNSWPDNRNLDKARRLLWPVKQKYGSRISWPDLMVFAGNRALESMGFTTFGFGGGRAEVWEPDDTYWGPEHEWLAEERYHGLHELDEPLAATGMGLVYVDPQGPSSNADPVLAGRDIRQTFARMGLNDEETVALIAGGHTVGKSHGPVDPNRTTCPEPAAAPLHAQGLGWLGGHCSGIGADTVTSGLEGMWTRTPVQWDHTFFETLFGYRWDVELSPAGMWQWIPADGEGEGTVPDPFDQDTSHHPVMLTTDLALAQDRTFEAISRRFLEHPDQFEDAFARAWFKLTHIDMGPIQRYLGALVPAERLIWQDPVPEVDHDLVDAGDIAALKAEILGSGLTVAQLVATAWASASTYRDSDKRGGANGARIRLEPQRGWEVNEPDQLDVVLPALEAVQERFNSSQTGGKRISMADLIVLGGCAAVEHAAAAGGLEVEVPFRAGRTDATQEWTDVESFGALRPRADGFRNYLGDGGRVSSEHLLVDRASLLTLSAPEMTVLVGGLRVLGATHRGSPEGVLTSAPGVLTNDFFVNLLDMGTVWAPRRPCDTREPIYEGRDADAGEVMWTASRVDLVFGSSSELRALSEVYASDDAGGRFVQDFVAAWVKVMELDRFDLR
jgi:catalase-peroxidase